MANDDKLIINDLHPACRSKFMGFYEAIRHTEGLSYVRPFEGWRSPAIQEKYRLRGSSKTGAWRSVHQYGFAVDFVPCPAGQWSWDWDGWDQLHALAENFGLHAPISWDKPHIVAIGWRADLRAWLLDNTFT